MIYKMTLLQGINNTIANFVENETNGFCKKDNNIQESINSYKIINTFFEGANISVGTLTVAPQEDPNIIFQGNKK